MIEGDGKMGRWGDEEMGRWGDGKETEIHPLSWSIGIARSPRHPTLREAPLFPRSYSANISRSVNGVVRQQNDRFPFIGAEAIVADIIR
ncbi:MAG: hypothetical protein F6K18_23460 [Okeania sp. SIO2C2]|uniref:hypothetical protein n=1 Tax=Okeania sp. SIO2C2 TaxID=2607787 RepID=UPI0013BDD17D|nr:hypothetical protein [Okeania sp. SIO2C2]NEP89548.1 hypothetical protein [Okeania sp. SIO2C2]